MNKFGKLFLGVGSFLTLVALGVLIVVFATSGNPKDVNPVSFTGAWTAQVNESTFVATITDDGIEIQWNQGDDTSALYWKGTFPVPLNAHNGDLFDVTSVGDVDAMSKSLLASQHTTKVFTYKDGQLDFVLTVTGVNQTIHLERSSNESQ
jgi:hypothetical protein